VSRRPPLVLCYHAVSDAWPDRLAVPAAALERQVSSLLARGLAPLSAAGVAEGRPGFHVTFDDAYRSVERALPALERLHVPATVFACSGYADAGGAPLAIPELAGEAAAHPDELATLDWDGLRSLAGRGVEVGSHTVGHPHLTSLSDEELARELADSKRRLEEELGRPCSYLAYPYGDEDARVQAAARAAGYEAAFALPGRAAAAHRHAIPRVGIYRRDTALRFRAKTSPFYETVSRLARSRSRPRASAA
jgi:peptidoglycan/xylan/chitin deacetylase (PgdA/CDA1 family)